MALLFVTAHQVIVLVHYHMVESWNLVGRVLQVSIHRNDNIALGSLETAIECGTLTVVAAEFDAFHVL